MQQFLGFDGELHGQFIHDFLGVTVDDETDSVFEGDADTWVVETYNDRILGLGRYYDGEKLISLFNFSDSDETAWINEVEDYVDLMTGKAREAKAVGIPACGFAWLLTTYKKNEQRKGRELPRLK